MPPLDVHSSTHYLALEKKNEHFMLECFLIHMIDGWMGRVFMCNETVLDECYLCLLAQVSFILEFFLPPSLPDPLCGVKGRSVLALQPTSFLRFLRGVG